MAKNAPYPSVVGAAKKLVRQQLNVVEPERQTKRGHRRSVTIEPGDYNTLLEQLFEETKARGRRVSLDTLVGEIVAAHCERRRKRA